ncbi:minor capsid protein [Emergencia sp. JLR.KK010]|uniref:minor capsid protein n=1 Tax=Emergencia sp. JLR.KK010 TaxID=3114296 RepID=UPI0030CDF301
MKNSAYWQKRFEILEEALGEYGEETYRGVQPYFDKALREINADIETWIYRIAKNNEISMKNARKLLDAGQLEEFKWTVEEYIKYGKENAINQQWVKQLENASAKFHISRLEALKIKVQQSAEKAFGNYLDDVDDMARKVYEEGYYRSAFELQRGFGVGWSISSIDEKKLSKLISKPWAADGRNFSDRIWQAKNQMVVDLHSELTRACILGKGPDEAIKNLSKYVDKRFKNAKVQAGRLVMTEQAFFSAAAQKDAFNELGVEEYEIVATLDSHTSEICQQLNGKHFPMSQYEPGVTAQPFHVSCRSTTCPYFDDEFTVGEMRAARGEDGKTYQVPADMTYPEWRESLVNINTPVDFKTSLLSGEADYTLDEAKELAKSANDLIDKYVGRGSKWSGNIVRCDDEFAARKLWNCDIELSRKSSPHVILHELLHARSISYYDSLVYRKNRVIEEATVELMAQVISKENGIQIKSSAYQEWIDGLQEIRHIFNMGEKDFAKMLFETPVYDRLVLLEDMAFDIIGVSGDIQTYQHFSEILSILETKA